MTNLKTITRWARTYTKFYNLGSVLIFRSSKTEETDANGYPLNNYFIIFGRPLSWKEIRWHIREAYCFGIVNKQFYEMRRLGNTTLRVSAKNSKKPQPRFVHYISNGDLTGCVEYVHLWRICRKINEGKKWS
jgi:hypothetical protein